MQDAKVGTGSVQVPYAELTPRLANVGGLKPALGAVKGIKIGTKSYDSGVRRDAWIEDCESRAFFPPA